MDGDIVENAFKFLLFAGWVWWRVQKSRREKAEAGGTVTAPKPAISVKAPKVAAASKRTSSSTSSAKAAAEAEVLAYLDKLEARAKQLRIDRRGLELGLGTLGTRARLFRALLDDDISPPLDGGFRTIKALRREATTNSGGSVLVANRLRHDAEVQAAIGDMARADRQFQLLSDLVEMRLDAEMGPLLADADAIAQQLIGPLQDFTTAHDIAFPALEVVTAPGTGHESVWMGLLPKEHPVVLVPDDFGDDLFRWPSIAHEVGHVVLRHVPGLADEIAEVTGIHGSTALLERSGDQITGTLAQPFAAWLPELVADVFTALFLGPSALFGFVHVFARPDDPQQVLWARARQDGRYDEHPPAHLRVRVMAALLEHLGFEGEVRGEVRQWDDVHGFDEDAGAEAPELSIFLPVLGGKPVAVGVERLLGVLVPAAVALAEAQYDSLAGFPLTSVPGLEMTPGYWARVKRRSADLLEGTPFRDQADVSLAAALLARHRKPERAHAIEIGLRQAILGKDTALTDRRERSLKRHGEGQSTDSFPHAIRDALLLREILVRPGTSRKRVGRR